MAEVFVRVYSLETLGFGYVLGINTDTKATRASPEFGYSSRYGTVTAQGDMIIPRDAVTDSDPLWYVIPPDMSQVTSGPPVAHAGFRTCESVVATRFALVAFVAPEGGFSETVRAYWFAPLGTSGDVLRTRVFVADTDNDESGPEAPSMDQSGNLFYTDEGHLIHKVDRDGAETVAMDLLTDPSYAEYDAPRYDVDLQASAYDNKRKRLFTWGHKHGLIDEEEVWFFRCDPATATWERLAQYPMSDFETLYFDQSGVVVDNYYYSIYGTRYMFRINLDTLVLEDWFIVPDGGGYILSNVGGSVPPLRMRQRDDGAVATGGRVPRRTQNMSTSRQASLRQGGKSTYW